MPLRNLQDVRGLGFRFHSGMEAASTQSYSNHLDIYWYCFGGFWGEKQISGRWLSLAVWGSHVGRILAVAVPGGSGQF